MKVLNRLVCILSLLLAIAVFVISFLLFQKREQLVKGWEKLATSISSSSAAMDVGSGTAYAKNLTTATLKHTQYLNLDSLLPEFKKQTGDIMKQRGELAGSLVKVTTALELSDVPAVSSLETVKTSKETADSVVASVEKFNQINNDVLSKVTTIGSKVGIEVNINGLKGDSAADNIAKITNGVTALKTKADTMASSLSDIAQTVDADSNFSDDNYHSAVVDTVSKTKEMKKRHDQYKEELEVAKNTINDLNGQLKVKENEIKVLTRKASALERALKAFRNETEEEAPKIDNSDPKLLRMVKGQIIEINTKWDYVVINLGKESTVEYKVGEKASMVPVNIPEGEEMVVVRGLDSKDPEFVGKIKIVQVNQNCSIGNIIQDAKAKKVKVGDTVYFSQQVIDKISKKAR